MGGGKGPETPPPRDYYKETSDSLRAQVNMAPQLYAAEAAFRPQYQRLELAGYRNSLLGRVTTDDLSATSRAEYDAAVAEAAGADAKLAQLQNQRAAIQQGIRVGRKGQIVYDSAGLQRVDAEIDRLNILKQTPIDPASFSDRGLIDILEKDVMPSMARAEAITTSRQRASDIADVEALGQRASQAYLDADPRSKALIETLNAQAMSALQQNGALTPEQQRFALQTARIGMADRGLAMGNQGLAADVLGTYQLTEARRTAAQQNAGAVLGLNKQFTADPFQAILGRQGQAFNAGMNQQQFASGFSQSIGPRLFNPESQYAADLSNSNQQTAAAYAAARAQVQSATIGAVGSAIGGIGGGWAQGLGSAAKAAGSGCWVAREVYGVDNPKWVIFRGWMLNESPEWFRSTYLKHGEKFAEYIKDKPLLKAVIQEGMDLIVYPRMTRIYA
jgi:hypothetical protein